MPTSHFETTQHFEWDTPWSFGLLVACGLVLAAWWLYQILREGRIANTRWGVLFVLLRTVVATVILWMILGPSSVLVRRETHPRTMAVYLDTSSSMQIQDQPDPLADRRWESSAEASVDATASADRAVLFASTMHQEIARLTALIDQQAPADERQKSFGRWRQLSDRCAERLEELSKNSLPADQQDLLQELRRTLKDDLQPDLPHSDAISSSDPEDRDAQLTRLGEVGEQFASRCRILADGLAREASTKSGGVASREGEAGRTRMARVVPTLKRGLTHFTRDSQDKFRLRLAQFSDRVATLPLETWESSLPNDNTSAARTATIRRTDLSELLRQIQDDAGKEDVAGAVILTDGRQTTDSPEDPRELVARLGVPLYIVPIGRGDMQRDLILHHLHAPPSVLQSDKILIEGMVTAYRCAGEGCEVQLLENGKVIESRQVTFKNDREDQRVSFEVPTEATGRREFKVHIPALADEHSTENNTVAVGVDIADSVLRLLVADGRARWEHQYLVNLLKRQDRMEFDQLKFAPHPAGTGKRESTNQFPVTVDEWAAYRVVVLGDVGPRQLGKESQEALRQYVVERGGCLIVIAGQNDMPQAFTGEPLEELLPVELASNFRLDRSGYHVEMTIEGKTADVMRLSDDLVSTEAIWREMSASLPIYFLSNYHKPKPTSQVLLRASPIEAGSGAREAPAYLSWHQVGAGRVAYLSSPSTYQLRMRNGDKYHHRFWGQLVRWIASNAAITGSKRVRLMADKSHYNQGDSARITVELIDEQGKAVTNAAPVIDAIQSGSVRSNVPLTPDPKIPGRYLGQFTTDESARYSLRVRGAEVESLLSSEGYRDPVQIEVTFEPALDRELLDPRSDRPLLEQLAERSGGMVLEPTALADLSLALPLEPRIAESSQRTALWDRWWCLWVILGCLTVEWLIRKQIGLA